MSTSTLEQNEIESAQETTTQPIQKELTQDEILVLRSELKNSEQLFCDAIMSGLNHSNL